MHVRILRQLRRARIQTELARSAAMSTAQLAGLEAHQRGHVENIVRISEKPGNLLSKGDISRLNPLINRLASVRSEHLSHLPWVIGQIVLLTEGVTAVTRLPERRMSNLHTNQNRPRSEKGSAGPHS
jgi:hypothetical protein